MYKQLIGIWKKKAIDLSTIYLFICKYNILEIKGDSPHYVRIWLL